MLSDSETTYRLVAITFIQGNNFRFQLLYWPPTSFFRATLAIFALPRSIVLRMTIYI